MAALMLCVWHPDVVDPAVDYAVDYADIGQAQGPALTGCLMLGDWSFCWR